MSPSPRLSTFLHPCIMRIWEKKSWQFEFFFHVVVENKRVAVIIQTTMNDVDYEKLHVWLEFSRHFSFSRWNTHDTMVSNPIWCGFQISTILYMFVHFALHWSLKRFLYVNNYFSRFVYFLPSFWIPKKNFKVFFLKILA